MNMPRFHVSLYVSDLNQSLNFYNNLFGQAPSKLKAGYLKYEIEYPGLIISFIENKDLVQSNFGHLGIQVFSDEALKGHLNRIQNSGLITREEMGTSCCYSVQDKFWVSSPDGVEWEFYLFKEDSQFNDPHYAQEGASACCSSSLETAQANEASACCTPQEQSSGSCEPSKEQIPTLIFEDDCNPASGCC
jgi:catechol 2,3-dioxygenase-like lactoylglutathione lyase family enzyme